MKLVPPLTALLLLTSDAAATEPRGGPAGVFQTEVPIAPFNLILGRPTRSSVAVSVLTASDMEGFISYGVACGPRTNRTETTRFQAGEPRVIPLDGLLPDACYRYAFCHRQASSDGFGSSTEHSFHTQRPPGGAFTFTVTADSHLDENTDPAVYERTLRSMLSDRPDFHIDLGDTFMTGKRRRAQDHGYRSGESQPGSGYLRVNVSPGGVGVVYVRTQ